LLPIACSPWFLKGHAWVFALSPLSSTAPFPKGWASPEMEDVLSKGGTFVGGVGAVQVVRYEDSPVGECFFKFSSE
jgi:hypothetical protein